MEQPTLCLSLPLSASHPQLLALAAASYCPNTLRAPRSSQSSSSSEGNIYFRHTKSPVMHSPSHTPLTPQSLNTAILQNKDDILFYFTCIRISPLFPNWFINLCAPLTSISLKVFAIGSFLGLIPASVLGACVQSLFFFSSILEVSALFSSSLVHHTLLQLCGQGACRPGCCWRAAAHSDI